MGQGHLHRAVRPGDGVDDIRRNPVGAQVHAQVQVGQAGIRGHVLAVHRPGDAAAQVQLHGDVLACHFLKHLGGDFRLSVHVDGDGVPRLGLTDLLLNVIPALAVAGVGAGGLGRDVRRFVIVPRAGLFRPAGVQGGVRGKDGVGGHPVAACRVPAQEVIPVPGGGGQAGQLAVHRGLGGRGGAAGGVKGDGKFLRFRGRDAHHLAVEVFPGVVDLVGDLRFRSKRGTHNGCRRWR